jgi:hypothetical protein
LGSPGVSLPVIGSVGKFTIFTFTKCNQKALVSGLLFGVGATVTTVGIILLGAGLAQRTTLGSAVLKAVPSPVKALGAARSASKASTAAIPKVAPPAPPAPPKPPKRAPLSDEETARIIAAGEAGAFRKPAKPKAA